MTTTRAETRRCIVTRVAGSRQLFDFDGRRFGDQGVDILDARRALETVLEDVGRQHLDVLGRDEIAALDHCARLERRKHQHERARRSALKHA